MKNKALLITGSTMLAASMILGASLAISKGRNKVSVHAAIPSKGTLTVDIGSNWGNGVESYKVAACFVDKDEHEVWSELASVEAPERFVALPYEYEIDPVKVLLYRYSIDLEQEAWEAEKKETKTAVTSDIGINKYINYDNNIVLSSDTYGLLDLPTAVHQIYLEDEDTHTSETVKLSDVTLNKHGHGQYEVTVALKAKDEFNLEGSMFANTLLEYITFGDGMNPDDLIYWQDVENPTELKGFEVKVTGTYTFAFDYFENHLEITKHVPAPVDPVDPSEEEETPKDSSDNSGLVTINTKDIFKIIVQIFKDAWDDLVRHFKNWFNLN